MKSLRLNLFTLLALLLIGTPSTAVAQNSVYEDGSVWEVSYVRTEPGQFDNYMENLSQVWKQFMDLAKERGYIKSYRILSSQPANRGDWNLMLLVEYPNMAALDNTEERFAPIRETVLGSLSEANQATVERRKLREIIGGKLTRELVFK